MSWLIALNDFSTGNISQQNYPINRTDDIKRAEMFPGFILGAMTNDNRDNRNGIELTNNTKRKLDIL